MFNNKKAADYNALSLDEFSDDDTLSDAEGDYPNSSNAKNNRNGGGPQDSLARQQQLMEQQDAGLEMLGQHAERLQGLSENLQRAGWRASRKRRIPHADEYQAR